MQLYWFFLLASTSQWIGALAQANSTTTAVPTTTTTAAVATTTAGATSVPTTTGDMQATADPCAIIRFDLRQMFSADASLTIENEECDVSVIVTASGGDLRCKVETGCGVGPSGKRKRQTMPDPNFQLNSANEYIVASISKPALFWRAAFGNFDVGIDTAAMDVRSLFQPDANLTSVATGRARWSAIDTVVEKGIELPVTDRVEIKPADSLAAFSVEWVEFKLYKTLPPTPAPPTTTSNMNATTDALGPVAEYDNIFEEWLNEDPIYFWLVVGAAGCCCCFCVLGLFCFFCVSFGDDDDDDEMFSMRDMSYDDSYI